MTRIKIADGIYLNIIQSDKFKTNHLKINFVLPLNAEIAPFAALLPQVLRRGTKNYPTMLELNRRLEYLYATSLGGAASKMGENEIIQFSAHFLRNELIPDGTDLISLVCDCMAEFIFSPALSENGFKSEYVESEKKNLLDRISAEINNKGVYANKRLFEIMCEGEPYAVSALGTAESVSAITSETLYDFYMDEFAKAPIEVFFVGICDENALCEKLREKLVSSVIKEAVPNVPVVKDKVCKLRRVCEEMPVNQGKLAFGFRTGACYEKKNTEKFLVFNEIFGGSPTSKLFENVREKLSLCYYCSSRFIFQKGIMNIASGVKVGNENAAEDEILRQLDAMKNGEFSENDIAEAKMSLTNSYTECFDDAEKLISLHLARILLGDTDFSIEKTVSKINAVSKEEIIEMANTVLLDTVYFLKGTNLTDDESEDEQ